MLLKKPPMGWNTWNTFGENINEELILETADRLIEDGYYKAGYEYVIIDDCWSERKRDPEGRLEADRNKFPHGMKYIADYLHNRGLKFGMYSDAGFYTCAGYPASFGHEVTDAQTFAEWGVDYLKYDFGFFPTSADPAAAYLTMAQALRMTGREILFAACTAGRENPHLWARSRGCHTYRSTNDISDSKASYTDIFRSQGECFENSTTGCFNDLDMLTVGMNGIGNVAAGGMTYEDYENHFLIWAFFGTPLIIGGDLRKMEKQYRKLLQSPEVIAINQDAECRPPFLIETFYEKAKVFARLLENGEIAVLAVNMHPETQTQKSLPLKISFDDLGIRTGSGIGIEFTNVLTGERIGTFEAGYGIRVKSERTVLLRGRMVKL